MRIPRQFGSVLLFGIIAAQAESPALKTFHDEKYGVKFQYPAQWTSGNEIVLGPAVAYLAAEDEPLGKIGFVVGRDGGPYAGTTLTDVVFAYNVIPCSTANQCRKRIEGNLNDTRRRVKTTLRGVTYDHFSYEGAGLGHQEHGEVYAAAKHGHCYLFEGVVHTVSMEGAKPLSAAQLDHLSAEFASIMRSVRYENAR